MIVKRFVIDVRNLTICISSDFVSEVRSAVCWSTGTLCPRVSGGLMAER